MTSSTSSIAVGAVVGDRYRIEGLLGEGGFGTVFRAVQLSLDRPVALKVLHPEIVENDGLVRFQREALLVQRLEHPNTVRLLDFGNAADGAPYLVFELLKGQTLEAALRSGAGLAPTRVHRVAAQILKALMEAHGRGIVHRDIKPANVFLCDFEGEPDFVKVLDFGIAKAVGMGALTRNGDLVGTPAYMAPEQITGRDVTFASDLYALGLTMSEALAGRPVFDGPSAAAIAHAQVSPGAVPHAAVVLQGELAPVILRATEKAPERRYASASEMLGHLDAIASGAFSGRSVGAPPPMDPGLGHAMTRAAPPLLVPPLPASPLRRPKKSGTPWALVGAIGGAAAILAVTLVVVLAPSSSSQRDPASAASPTSVPTVRPFTVRPRLRLADVTLQELVERVQEAGYEVISNVESGDKNSKTLSVSLKKGSTNGFLTLYRLKDGEGARGTEEVFARMSDSAVLREEGNVLTIRVLNGAEPGNARSRELMALIRR